MSLGPEPGTCEGLHLSKTHQGPLKQSGIATCVQELTSWTQQKSVIQLSCFSACALWAHQRAGTWSPNWELLNAATSAWTGRRGHGLESPRGINDRNGPLGLVLNKPWGLGTKWKGNSRKTKSQKPRRARETKQKPRRARVTKTNQRNRG